MSGRGMGKLHFIEGMVNVAKYRDLGDQFSSLCIPLYFLWGGIYSPTRWCRGSFSQGIIKILRPIKKRIQVVINDREGVS